MVLSANIILFAPRIGLFAWRALQFVVEKLLLTRVKNEINLGVDKFYKGTGRNEQRKIELETGVAALSMMSRAESN